tara:strand:+ start:2214 stop:3077 length:864 start_codon:yes stop_codon:yes gene_type:complete
MSDIIFKLGNPLELKQGTGFTLERNGISSETIRIDGSDSSIVRVSIGQEVATNSSVQFGKVTLGSNSLTIGSGSNDVLVFNDGNIVGDLKFNDRLVVTGNLNTIGNLFYNGSVSASNFETDLNTASHSVQTGSTRFGETTSDKHFFTSSLNVSSSFTLNGTKVNEISNDSSLTDQNTNALITEHATLQYLLSTNPLKDYLRKSFVHTGSFVNSSTIRFSATTASAPTGTIETTENDFMFFVNGMLIENDALTIQQNSSNLDLSLDTNSLGYTLTLSDEVIGFGKFNS